jgi:hypothetical protein
LDATYIFLCGIAWARSEEESAGLELIHATSSSDSELRELARAMLQLAGDRSKRLIGKALSQGEMSAVQACLCAFEQEQRFSRGLFARDHCFFRRSENRGGGGSVRP